MTSPTPRTEVRRLAERGRYDTATIEAVLDEALVCHVGFVHDGHPVVIPTIYARVGAELYLHGSPASRMLRTLRSGAEVCVTVTIVDGLVVARAAFHNSMNYRSVVIFGVPRVVDDIEEKERAVEAITNHMIPGRWAEARPMTEKEMKGTLVVALGLDEASAKVRTGPPVDDESDYAQDIWAGILPLRVETGEAIPDPALRGDVVIPPSVARYRCS